MHCRETLFTPRCSPRASSEVQSIFLYDVGLRLRSYGASKLPNFRILAYFLHTNPLEVPSGNQATSSYIAEWFRFFHDSRRSKGVSSGTGDFLRLLIFTDTALLGELGPPNFPKFSPMANGYIHTECNCTARQIWTKDVWKRAVLRTDVFSHQISLPLPSTSPQNPILWDLSMQNLLYITDSSP